MKWLTKYFNKKVNNEDLFLNHLKTTYDFDEACIIKKEDPDFLTIINIVATAVVDRDNKPLGVTPADPNAVEKLVNKILSECAYSIIKFSRNYTMSKSHYYVLFSTNVNGYSISSRYVTDDKLFGEFSHLNVFHHYDRLIRTKNYRFINNKENNRLIPSYSVRLPLRSDGRLHSDLHYFRLESCCRDLEIIIDTYESDNKPNYCVQLFYGVNLLKEETIDNMNNFFLFLDDFLFPYNLKKELIDEVGIQLPLKFTPEFVKSMNKDFKLTIDMLKI